MIDRTMTLTFVLQDDDDVWETLDRIAAKVKEGYTSGYEDVCPYWMLREEFTREEAS